MPGYWGEATSSHHKFSEANFSNNAEAILKMENTRRRSGRRSAMHEGLTEEQKGIKGDKRPDFIYTT